eukprot:CAMPEP_0197912274 /NCGR_PEP_ID=MMETSP1439-20131203/74458_1 /TAXON_ID=66791 /ORGANISM="Gonyaulax spinifera, Strain CCMP409" /LENGTH=62 /DNA_ID=CAMNT_0043534051 /DNA_START=67 /DNA_END=255 /DNA_ORIENTATION=+
MTPSTPLKRAVGAFAPGSPRRPGDDPRQERHRRSELGGAPAAAGAETSAGVFANDTASQEQG